MSSEKENSSNDSEAKKMKSGDDVPTPGKQRTRANPTTRWTNDEVERLLEYVRANRGSFEVFIEQLQFFLCHAVTT